MAMDYPSRGKGGRQGNKLGMKSGGEKSIAMIDTEYGCRTRAVGCGDSGRILAFFLFSDVALAPVGGWDKWSSDISYRPSRITSNDYFDPLNLIILSVSWMVKSEFLGQKRPKHVHIKYQNKHTNLFTWYNFSKLKKIISVK